MKNLTLQRSSKIGFLVTTLVGLLAAGSLSRAQIVTYTFPDGDEHATTVAASQSDPNATAGTIGRTNLAPGASNINIAGYFEVGGDGGFTTAHTYDLTKYVSFSVAPDPGYILTYSPTSTLTFNVGIQDTSSSSPGGIDVQYSTNNFATSTDLGSTAITTFYGQSVTLSLAGLSDVFLPANAQFRFYFDGAPNPYETGLIGDIVVNGNVIPAPEPTSLALILGGMLMLAVVGLRRRAQA